MHSGGHLWGTAQGIEGGLFQNRAGHYPGAGRFLEGRITKAVIVCQIDRVGGNISASSHGHATAKLEQFVGFVVNRLIIQFHHQQPPTAMNQITLLRSTWMQAGSSTSTTSGQLTVDATEREAMAQTGRT